jgi:hypothetical protein
MELLDYATVAHCQNITKALLAKSIPFFIHKYVFKIANNKLFIKKIIYRLFR